MARPSNSSKKPAHNGINQLRIIGGEWRSRRLSFPDAPGLRPTPDRVRETLFNWLAPYVAGARVLDPFAGSGALFLEALSRGAAMGQAPGDPPRISLTAAVTSVSSELFVLQDRDNPVWSAGASISRPPTPCAIWTANLPALSTWCSSTRRSTRTCCRRSARCSRNASGWPRMPGSTLKAKPLRRSSACRAIGACIASRNPDGCTTHCGNEWQKPSADGWPLHREQ